MTTDPYKLLPPLIAKRTRRDRELAYLRGLTREVALSTRRRDLVAFVSITTGSSTTKDVGEALGLPTAAVKDLVDAAAVLVTEYPRAEAESTGPTDTTG